MTEVRQQASQSFHSEELSKMRMDCANQMEDQRVTFDEEKAALRAELNDVLVKTQAQRADLDQQIIEHRKNAMDSEANIRELQRKLNSEVSARERMEADWKGASEQKGSIESNLMVVVGEKVRLETRVDLLTQDVQSKIEVRMFFIIPFSTHSIVY